MAHRPIARYGFYRRTTFGRFLHGKGLTGRSVEVGTHRGEFALEFLNGWRGKKLFCVDHYPHNYDPDDPAAVSDREADSTAAIERLRRFRNRVEFVREPSEKAVAKFAESSLDFVYVDAKHRYEDVSRDLSLWWKKVKPGGVLAGHDIVCPSEPTTGGWGREVYPAVMDFMAETGQDVWLVNEPDVHPWSFYMLKP